jgi:hypothetical protein
MQKMPYAVSEFFYIASIREKLFYSGKSGNYMYIEFRTRNFSDAQIFTVL